jgi:hypothetical protein
MNKSYQHKSQHKPKGNNMSNKQEQLNAAKELSTILRDIPGDTIYTVIRHVSNSGMQREISVKLIDAGRIIHLDYLVGDALGLKSGSHNGLKIRGCGMDMGFHLVDSINRVCGNGKKFRQEWI